MRWSLVSFISAAINCKRRYTMFIFLPRGFLIFLSSCHPSFNWLVDKVRRRKDAKCCTCRSTMPEGKIFLPAKGFYIPPNQTFAIKRTFYFCLMKSCVSRKPFMSSIAVPPQSVSIAISAVLTIEDMDIIRNVPLILFSIFFFFFFFMSLLSSVHFYFLLGTHVIGVVV